MPLGKTGCFGAVSVDAPEPLAISIEYRHQKVTMFPPLVCAEVGYFSFFLYFWLRRRCCCFFCLFHGHSLCGHVPDCNDYDNRRSASQLIFERKCIFLRRNQLPRKKTIAPLLTLYELSTRLAGRSNSRVGTVQFVMSRYGNFTKEIVRLGQLFSILDV